MTEDYFEWDVAAEEEAAYVEANENGYVHDGSLYADDIGSCIAVGVYEPETNEAYLSHLRTLGRMTEDFTSQISVFLDLLPEMDEPEVVVTGGTYPSPEDTIDTDFGDRTAVDTHNVGGLKTTVARLMEENVSADVEYDSPGKQNTELTVDTEEGIDINHWV